MPAPPLQLLLIEDSVRDAELTLFTLERAGLDIQATTVHNHQAAAKLLQAQAFDLILSDVLLPGSSGEQALSVARELAPLTPFIVISGVFGEEHAVKMMRAGATDYVLKQSLPLLPSAVRRALAEVDERRQRQRAERDLHDAESRARIAIEAARMGTWDFDPRTELLIWDARCREMYELDEQTPVSMELFFDRLHPDDRARVERGVEESLASARTYQVDYRVRLPTGAERWFKTSGRSTFEEGRCVRFTGVVQDITEQKQATEALERLNDLLSDRVQKRTRERDRTWELSRELLAVMRADTTPEALNPAWEATLGLTRAQLAGMRLADLTHPADQAATSRELGRLALGNVSSRFVNRLRHANGDYRWMSWTIVPDGEMLYAAVRDITSERQVLDTLAATNERLREQIDERERVEAALQQMQRLEAVGQLTAGVAHDFNNLLTVILGSTHFLLRDLGRGQTDRFASRLQNILEAGERGARLTGQLLAFSRRQRLQPAAVNLNDTVQGMLDLLQRTLGGSIWIETDTAPALWSALVDATQTEMIILNLAINARDAMPKGGALRLSTYNETVQVPARRPEDPEPGDYVVLAIQDSGCGMSEAVLAKAFEPFFTTKEVGKGSGLGLAQVFGFAKQSGGGVAITTEEGRGTTVKVYLPGVSGPQLREKPAEKAVAEAPGQQHRILLVDDDPDVRSVTALLLEGLGYTVLEADGADQALLRLHEGVDLLVTDYAMPGMNGAQLADEARNRQPGLPVVFITGYAEIGGLDPGQQLIVQKPYREEDLAAALSQAIARPLPQS
ncbi:MULTISPECIES: response regulator [unclassified Pseudomonas]|uniref:response regulator n=1 Tax=unclassified Pseudomonas TaxID=196821 RepID=UPI000BCC46D1|nr:MULTISPECIES: response regulator [unclassified Pseudomonas]PVZ13534.1 PAS domain S-box-containing protein [Pseudomonas sp. URIL14HWK12:I12]PVZ23840.1 PAS domain S-box-containing protein [Pseudomonas sp. URIL14HWK12:I10]PVZ33521.1 PAS domain S-box-containing protein [Pseudomonas sp. URIL14HWK12:I11]SNZ11900.1 PAS domain S-box-containing protein [Pseudomonas sp. URIL14HWK12:I9]